MSNTEPTYGNGKICYLEIPAIDISTSANFYKEVFGWEIRQRDNGSTAFNDSVGQVSGTWVTNVKPLKDVGILIYIMVDNVEATLDAIEKNGGQIVEKVGRHLPEILARFTDPAGNIMALYQQP